MRVFIYACENIYHGLHGIEDMTVVEVDSIEEANEYGMEMSADVIESWDTFDDFDEYENEEDYKEVFLEAREWYIYSIDEEKAKDISTDKLNKLVCSLGHEYFVEKYCGEMID